jgi:hypothetical protein
MFKVRVFRRAAAALLALDKPIDQLMGPDGRTPDVPASPADLLPDVNASAWLWREAVEIMPTQERLNARGPWLFHGPARTS